MQTQNAWAPKSPSIPFHSTVFVHLQSIVSAIAKLLIWIPGDPWKWTVPVTQTQTTNLPLVHSQNSSKYGNKNRLEKAVKAPRFFTEGCCECVRKPQDPEKVDPGP